MSPTVWRDGTVPASSVIVSQASRTALAVIRVMVKGGLQLEVGLGVRVNEAADVAFQRRVEFLGRRPPA